MLIIEKSKLNLMDTIYENDKSPLMENCDCYACKHFTKGYLHHLFNCHELLGVILLYVNERRIMLRTQHNIHHFIQFMSNARQSIATNEFDKFYEDFMKNCSESSL